MAPLPLLLFTQRRALRSLFDHPGRPGDPRFALTRLCLSEDALQTDEQAVAQAAGAVIDAVPEPALAVRVARELHTLRPDLPLLALVCCPSALPPSFIKALIEAGVQGFQDLSDGRHRIQQTLVDLQPGQRVFRLAAAPLAAHALADLLHGRPSPATSPPSLLTPREQAVLQRLSAGLTEAEIARQEQVSVSTVKRVIVRLETKLAATSLFQLGAHAHAQGLLS
jgi:DNA-binding NarL/FixJ family response regulator